MRICVYTIAKNEALHVQRWCDATAAADYRFVLDTGSTDDTVALLQGNGVHVETQLFDLFRFDVARQAALDRLPADIDVCVSLDLDEVLVPDWRLIIEDHWSAATNRLLYGFAHAFDQFGRPTSVYKHTKVHGRHTHHWRHAAYELLVPLGADCWSKCEQVLVEHYPDNSKSREHYVPLTEQAVAEAPGDNYLSHHLGHEYLFYRRYDDAVRELKRHLGLPSATWAVERCRSAVLIARAYLAQADVSAAEEWFRRAIDEDPSSREALVEFAAFLLDHDRFEQALHYALTATRAASLSASLLEAYAQREGPYDIAALASCCLGRMDEALRYGRLAVELNQDDLRLRKKLAAYKGVVAALASGRRLQIPAPLLEA